MRRIHAKKPKILKDKIYLANLMLKKLPAEDFMKHPRRTYWSAVFEFEGVKYYVFFQRYARNPSLVDYIRILYKDNYTALTRNQIRELLPKIDYSQ